MAADQFSSARRTWTPVEHTCDADDKGRCRCRKSRPSRVRRDNLWRKYRMTPEDYDAMRRAQRYRCAICGAHEDEIKQQSTGRRRMDGAPTALAQKLVVDHCHASGRVRALLCQRCNLTLARVNDDPKLLRAAANYLNKWRLPVALVDSAESS